LDTRKIVANVGTFDIAHEADLAVHVGATHKRGPPGDARGREPIPEPAGHAVLGPGCDAFTFDLGDQGGQLFCATWPKRWRRADYRERLHSVGMTCSERARNGSSELGADQMHAFAFQCVEQRDVIVHQQLDAPTEAARHRCRRAEAAHVRAHDLQMSRKVRNPSVPDHAAFSEPMQKNHGLWLAPGIGIAVYDIVHRQVRVDTQVRHRALSSG
jgi:hypothetical protein